MNSENTSSDDQHKEGSKRMKNNGMSNGVYGLGFIGALVFYIQHSATFGQGVIGFLKALVWPAFVIYRLMDFLKM